VTIDVFLFQRGMPPAGAVTLVSHTPASATTTANGSGYGHVISADGTSVAFRSTATNLVAGQNDANDAFDVFLFERATGTVSLVSHTPTSATTTGDGSSGSGAFVDSPSASISADGAFVAFQSTATNLVAGQSEINFDRDVFLFERSADVGRPPADFDGDGDTDVAVFRPSNGYWFVQGGTVTQFGTSGDIPVPGDFDGDGDTDVAVFRPSNGYWFVQGGTVTQFGTSGDIPLPLPDAIRRFFLPPP
jgi:putative transposon-encoded protein